MSHICTYTYIYITWTLSLASFPLLEGKVLRNQDLWTEPWIQKAVYSSAASLWGLWVGINYGETMKSAWDTLEMVCPLAGKLAHIRSTGPCNIGVPINCQYYFGGSLLQYNGPRNPILIIKAPILDPMAWLVAERVAQGSVLQVTLKNSSCKWHLFFERGFLGWSTEFMLERIEPISAPVSTSRSSSISFPVPPSAALIRQTFVLSLHFEEWMSHSWNVQLHVCLWHPVASLTRLLETAAFSG